MPFRAEPTDLFEASLKALHGAYPKSKPDVEKLINDVEKNPQHGKPIPGFNSLLYKVRGALKSHKIGKRGGLRLVYYFDRIKLYLLYIYSKRHRQNHPDKLLKDWLKSHGYIPQESEN